MVRASNLHSKENENSAYAPTMDPGKHNRTDSSSTSSVAGSTMSNSDRTCRLYCDSPWHPPPHDLSESNLSDFMASSSSSDCEDDERIKLLCGDDVEEWSALTADQPRFVKNDEITNKRRGRILPKLPKSLHRIRRKLNWQFLLFVVLLFLIFLIVSQLNNSQNSTASVAGWDVNRTRDATKYVLPDLYTATLEPRVVDRTKRYLLIVVVCSAVENFGTRQTIRQTWANGSEFSYEDAFYRMHRYANSYASVNQGILLGVRQQLFGKGPSSQAQSEQGLGYDDHMDLDIVRAEGSDEEGHPLDLLEGLNSQVIFLVGKPQSDATQALLLEESAKFGDMLQENFVDTYNNLTLKSLMLLKWINNFNDNGVVPRVKFVMKCDDDTFLNLPNLVHILLGGKVPIYKDTVKMYTGETINERHASTEGRALMGFLFRNAKPIRDATSKWYAPKYMYHKKIFPNYLSGTGYVIEATHTARELYKTALTTPLFHLEDVYITGLCASRSSGTQPRHHPLFSFLRYGERKCALRGMVTQHPMTASEIRTAYEALTNDSVRCDQPPEDHLEKMQYTSSASTTSLVLEEFGIWWHIATLATVTTIRS